LGPLRRRPPGEEPRLRSPPGREEFNAVARADFKDRDHVGRVAGQRAERLHAGLESSWCRQDQRTAVAAVADPEGMRHAAGRVDRRPAASLESAVSYPELKFPFQDVEGLIFPRVDVRRQVGSGGVQVIEEREGPLTLLAADLEQELDAAE